MANLVNGAVLRYGAEVTIAALDANEVMYERTKVFEFNVGVVLYADALAALAALLTAFDAINNADIVRYRLTTIFDTTTGDATALGDVYKEAILSLRIAGSGIKKATHTIFAPYDAMISGKSVVSTAPLQTYLDLFETGGDFALSDGEFISTAEATRIAASRTRHVGASS